MAWRQRRLRATPLRPGLEILGQVVVLRLQAGGFVGDHLKTLISELRPPSHRRGTAGNGSIHRLSRPQMTQEYNVVAADLIGVGP